LSHIHDFFFAFGSLKGGSHLTDCILLLVMCSSSSSVFHRLLDRKQIMREEVLEFVREWQLPFVIHPQYLISRDWCCCRLSSVDISNSLSHQRWLDVVIFFKTLESLAASFNFNLMQVLGIQVGMTRNFL